MCSRELEEDVGTTIATQEVGVLRSIGIISLCGVVLYVCGFVWRSSYFSWLGVPTAVVDYPLPKMLIPDTTVVVFIVQTVLTFAALKYHSFYERQRRLRRAKRIGVNYPLDDIVRYTLQKNANANRSSHSNHEVFMQSLGEHLTRIAQADPHEEFDVKRFAKEVIPLFPDLLPEMADSFVRYELQLVAMSRRELVETVVDSVGRQPQGSKEYNEVNMLVSGGAAVFLIIGAVLWTSNCLPTLIAALLGAGTGFVLSHMSNVEDRYQFWHTVWVAVVLLIIVNGIDGSVAAARSRAGYSLPFVTIAGTDGASHKGVLLGEFSDAYIIEPYDEDDLCHCMKIHKQGVRSVEIRNTWRLEAAKRIANRALGRTREETDRLTRTLNAHSGTHPIADANTPPNGKKTD